ncbi:MAG: response regulator transcription factor [Thermoleophilia bacterium]
MNHTASVQRTGQSSTEADSHRRLSLLLVDDHLVVREGVRRLLAQHDDIVVVGEASSGTEALELVDRRRPDVVLMDIQMPGMDGIQATKRMVEAAPDLRIVMFTAHAEQELLMEALDSGADGFVLKDSESTILVQALHQVAGGEAFVDPRLAPDLLRQFTSPRNTTNVLSARELEILQMLADGASNREVAEALVVSVETVKTHVKHILAKLEAEHRTQAVAIGIRQSLIH